MSKSPSGKSIIANFGALSSSTPEPDDGAPPRVRSQPIARVGAGVIGATQRSLSDIREERDRLQALVAAGGGLELDPDLIDPSPFPDRLPDDSDIDFEEFRKLISDEGQKISIQVRTHPSVSGRYQIVYGHRRWRACRDLGIKVKAILIELTDTELVVAQGIENAARQDLSWIERALFVWRMDKAGIKARDIRAALAVDDPELARLRSVCRAVPVEVIEAIGRAPKVGRPRWVELAMSVANESNALERIRVTLSSDKVSALASDERFRRALTAIKRRAPEESRAIELKSPEGKIVGRASFSGADVKLTVDKTRAKAFSTFLKEELPSLMERFFATESEE
jgi:ParB family transcriptional regulator, chromosome partitioning protein